MKAGDIVQLLTGGPNMTIESVVTGPPEQVNCVWFCVAGGIWSGPCRGTFLSAALKKVKP